MATFDTASLRTAIDEVLSSFGDDHAPQSGVLVQRFVPDVAVAGVVTTLDFNRVPYLTIDFDDITGRTDRVTSGHDARRVRIVPGAEDLPSRWAALVKAIEEIRTILRHHDLVIEFAFEQLGTLHVFQVWDRGRSMRITIPDLRRTVTGARQELSRMRRRDRTVVLSDMCDWNPAEMLGSRPGPLDVSLYRSLITDAVWARARGALGYFTCKGALVVRVGDHPYVNVALSFRSLTPAGISHETRARYVEICMERVLEDPTLHDKVEHAVLMTYWPIRMGGPASDVLARLKGQAARTEYAWHLRALTKNLFSQWERHLAKVARSGEILIAWRSANRIQDLESRPLHVLLTFIRHAIKVCRQHGTLPFSIAARLAFVADGLLRELETGGECDPLEVEEFWRGVRTPADQLAQDLGNFHLSDEDICALHGHLRPHTYNIESQRYDDRPDFISALRKLPRLSEARQPPGPSPLLSSIEAALEAYLASLGVQGSLSALVESLATAVTTREAHKFIFSAVVSDILEVIALLAQRFGLSRADVRCLDVGRLLRLFEQGDAGALHEAVALARLKAEEWRLLHYPDLMAPHADLTLVELVAARPTFVTDRAVDAPVAVVEGILDDPTRIDGHVVAIEAADPGFDWIFARPVAGLLTCYGGSTSHMAIRCHELQIPAAIGCGQSRFEEILHSHRVILDCNNGIIAPQGSLWA